MDYKPRLNQSDISTEHERNIIHFIIFQTIFSFLVLLTILWFDFKDHHIVGFWFHIATPWNWWHSKHCIFLRQFLLTLVDITKFLIWVLTNHKTLYLSAHNLNWVNILCHLAMIILIVCKLANFMKLKFFNNIHLNRRLHACWKI